VIVFAELIQELQEKFPPSELSGLAVETPLVVTPVRVKVCSWHEPAVIDVKAELRGNPTA
jgi:hypothetical protein